MIWALPVGLAALGYLQGEKKRKQELAMAMGNAEANRFSPWTRMNNQIHAPTSDGLSSAMQGGLSGAMMAQSFGKDVPTATAPSADAPPSQLAEMGQQNGEMMDKGRYDQAQGVDFSRMPRKNFNYWG